MAARGAIASRAAACLLAALLALAAFTAARASAAPPRLVAPSAILIDARTGDVLYSRNAADRRSIASTTKLMTAMVTLARTQPEELFVAPAYNPGPAESKIGIHRGEKMTVHDLLRAVMLPSANDAAYDLAVNVGGSERRFVKLMNRRAEALGLRDTHYTTPVGLDDPGNYSTAHDLARLAALDLRNRTFAKIVNLPSAHLQSGSHPRTVVNRNDLVAKYPFVNGVKTGHTLRAGYVLVGSAAGNGAEVVSVVLGDPGEASRDSDTLALLRYGVARFRRIRPLVAGREYASAKVRFRGDARVRLVAKHSFYFTARRGMRVTRRVSAPDELVGPIARGTAVGSVSVVYRGKVVRTVPLVTASKVEGAGFVRRAASAMGGWLAAIAFVALVGAAALAGMRLRVRSRRGTRETAGQ